MKSGNLAVSKIIGSLYSSWKKRTMWNSERQVVAFRSADRISAEMMIARKLERMKTFLTDNIWTSASSVISIYTIKFPKFWTEDTLVRWKLETKYYTSNHGYLYYITGTIHVRPANQDKVFYNTLIYSGRSKRKVLRKYMRNLKLLISNVQTDYEDPIEFST